jgi:nucleoside-triphosphatase THEP1
MNRTDYPLKITITGRPGPGKTTMALALLELLQLEGFNVELIPDVSEPLLVTAALKKTLPIRLAEMKAHKKKIIIAMEQANRESGL